jgi:hypothetical protein
MNEIGGREVPIRLCKNSSFCGYLTSLLSYWGGFNCSNIRSTQLVDFFLKKKNCSSFIFVLFSLASGRQTFAKWFLLFMLKYNRMVKRKRLNYSHPI